jgi:hypothetical protein
VVRAGTTTTISNGVAEQPQAAETAAEDAEHTQAADEQTEASTQAAVESQTAAPEATGTRAEHVARLGKLLEAAREVPEIIDWQRLRQQVIERLRTIAQQSSDPSDFAPAATLMIQGKLAQHAALPSAEALFLLHRSVTRLGSTVSGADLATIGGELAQW